MSLDLRRSQAAKRPLLRRPALKRMALELVVALAGFFFFYLKMGYPWSLASLAGAALGALVFSTRQALVSVGELHRPFGERREDLDDGDPDPPSRRDT